MAFPKKSVKPRAKRVTFQVCANPGSKVCIAGSFNDWNPEAHPLIDPTGTGEFAATLSLQPGTYEYKFVIDGTWCVDPACMEWTQNNLGTLNSIRKV